MNADIINDDFIGEANEIYSVNSWLCYTNELHNFREFGVSDKPLDLLDETPFKQFQIEEMRKFIGSEDKILLR